MCTCESGTKRRRTTLNLSASIQEHHPLKPQQQQRSRRKRPRGYRRVRFAEPEAEQPQPEPEAPHSAAYYGWLPSAPLQPRHPFVPSDQWLQPWEQMQQRHEAVKEAKQLSGDPDAERFRDLYQSIYQVCHALAAAAAESSPSHSSNNEDINTVLPKPIVVVCAQLLSSNSSCTTSRRENHSTLPVTNTSIRSSTPTTTRRGLEDGLVPLVALARRLERRQTIRAVLALQTQPAVAALVSQHLSTAHGKFAHALALGDAAAAQLVYNEDEQVGTF